MKKLHSILFILIINISFAQTKQFIYEYISVPDSTQKKESKSEIMVLNIGKDKSEYFSLGQFESDSTMLVGSKKGLFMGPPNKIMSRDRVNKIANSDQIEFIKQLSFTQYFVTENINFTWTLHPEYISVLNYKAQKATTEYGGRKWIAWFAENIPFQDGPYKFKGLPGLILKIEDETKSHQFELKGIKNSNYDFAYPTLNNYSKIDLNSQKFIKVYKNYRVNPATDSVGKFPDQRDSEGNFRRGIDIFKELEKNLKKLIEKDNNIIEIDLLKK